MIKVNIIVVILLIQSLQVFGLRCYKCNQTEIFTRKCVLDSSDEVECLDGEVCSYGRTVHSKDRQDLVGCEKKESCDADRAIGLTCETCDTNLCNLFARRVVSFENRIEIINMPSRTTIIKEEILPQKPLTDSRPVINGIRPFPGLEKTLPFFNMHLPTFGTFGFNNYGFPGSINNPQQGVSPTFSDNFFKPPFFISSTSHYQPEPVPPYAPFAGFEGPFGPPPVPSSYIPEPETHVPVYAPDHGQNEIIPPRQDNEVTLQETILQLSENNKPSTTNIEDLLHNKLTTTEIPEKKPEQETTSHEEVSTVKTPSLASSILQQFPSSPSSSLPVEPNRNPSISDLVLNWGSNNAEPSKKPLVQLPLDFTESTTFDIPVTIPEIIEVESFTETSLANDLPTNKDFGTDLNDTITTTLTPNLKDESSTLLIKPEIDESELISPTTKDTPVMTRTADDNDNDENSVVPSLTEPENIRFNNRVNTKVTDDKKLDDIKFPNVETENFYFEQGNQNAPVSDVLTFEALNQSPSETPVFSKLN